MIRAVQRQQAEHPQAAADVRLKTLLERAERIRTQCRHDHHKLYALHAPEVECLAKGKAHKRYEFGVKVSIAMTHRGNLVVGARSFPGNPYACPERCRRNGHVLAAQLEQTQTLIDGHGVTPRQVVVDLGFRGVDADNPDVRIIHRGKSKSLTAQERRWLKRRQAVEPIIGHLKADHRMNRCWLKGTIGDAIHAVLCAAGYNLRATVRLGLTGSFLRLHLDVAGTSIRRSTALDVASKLDSARIGCRVLSFAGATI